MVESLQTETPSQALEGPLESEGDLELPRKIFDLFYKPDGTMRPIGVDVCEDENGNAVPYELGGTGRYIIIYGGRGSCKSYSVNAMLALWGALWPLRICCTRDLQASIQQSTHVDLSRVIREYSGLTSHYDVGLEKIIGKNGTEFFFRGLRHAEGGIKSMSGVKVCFVEEAEAVGESSWIELIPTIREDRSVFLIVFNPDKEGSATDLRFRQHPPRNSRVCEINWMDCGVRENGKPFFPAVLEEERQHDLETMSAGLYAHIWEGAYLKNSDAQVFAGKCRQAEFTPTLDWQGPFIGLDFGFSTNPTAATKSWIYGNTLYTEYEAGKKRLELDHTVKYLSELVPGFKNYPVESDCRESAGISYLQNNGLANARAAEKWAGSIIAGCRFIRSFDEWVIHPRCTQTWRETELYSFKVLPNGEITDEPLDKYNDFIDSIRYALWKKIKIGRVGMFRLETYTPPELRGGPSFGLDEAKVTRLYPRSNMRMTRSSNRTGMYGI